MIENQTYTTFNTGLPEKPFNYVERNCKVESDLLLPSLRTLLELGRVICYPERDMNKKTDGNYICFKNII